MNIKIISHRRSGTHLLWNVIKSNFDVLTDKTKPSIREDGCGLKKDYFKKRICIYQLRDIRGCLLSDYNFLKTANGPAAKKEINSQFNEISFYDYLKNGIILNKRCTKAMAANFKDPIGFWIDHVEWSKHLPTIKFEDILIDQTAVINNISTILNCPLKHEPVIWTKPVGPKRRQAGPYDWKNRIDANTLDYIWERAGEVLMDLGYDNI